MLFFRWGIAALLAGACCAACGSNDDSGAKPPAQPGSVSDEERAACAVHATAWCARRAECSPYNIPHFDGTLENCEAKARRGCERQFVLPGSTETIEALQACTASMPTAVCGRAFGVVVGSPECESPSGTLETGALCSEDEQCQSGECRKTLGEECSHCVEPPAKTAPIGAECHPTDGPGCAQGECVLLECVRIARPGQACDENTFCFGFLPCRNGVCSAALPGGSACNENADCVYGYACSEGVCTLEPPQSTPAGAACGDAVLSWCDPSTQYCAGAAGSVGQCEPLAQQGQPCEPDVNGNSSCDSLLACVDGVCSVELVSSCE